MKKLSEAVLQIILAKCSSLLQQGDNKFAFYLLSFLSFWNKKDYRILQLYSQYYQKQNNWEKVLFYLESMNHQAPEQNPLRVAYRIANARLKLGEIELAGKLFEKIKDNYPDSHLGFLGLAKVAIETQDWPLALQTIDKLISSFSLSKNQEIIHLKKKILIQSNQISEAIDLAVNCLPDSIRKNYIQIQNRKDKLLTPLSFKTILIVTYGRSGSTLLQGVLNSIPGVTIRGENENVFFNLFTFYKKMSFLKENYSLALLPSQPWFGAAFFNMESINTQLRELAKSMLAIPDDNGIQTVYGFKEIRYNELGDNLEPYLDFLQLIFPDVALIFNTRNLSDVVKSAWWGEENPKKVIRALKQVEKRFHAYAAQRSNCFEISYEDLVQQSQKLKNMFQFLGAYYDEQSIKLILDTPHSYKQV